MKTLLLVLPLVVAGCNTTTFEQKHEDGTYTKITNTRSVWSTDSYTCTLNTNGVASLTANKSSVDSNAIAAVAQGVAQGVMAAPK